MTKDSFPYSLAVWRDYGGRFSPLKAVTLVLVLLPAGRLALLWALHDLGGRPITEVLHGLGDWTVRFLLLTLAVTPARAVLDWPGVVKLRRLLGVTTACYAGAHLTLYCVDQMWALGTVASEIVLRFYLTIGFAALLMLGVLGVTSTDGWQKRLGQRWKKLHRLVFVLLPLALWHYFLQSKADVSSAAFFTGLACWLMLWRLAPRRWRGRLLLLPPLALLAGLACAGIEAGWYAVATGARAWLVLEANLDVTFGPRPAVAAVLCGLAVFVMAAVRRAVGRWRRAGPTVRHVAMADDGAAFAAQGRGCRGPAVIRPTRKIRSRND
jgi:sulfoxide reductase heme-binding subunit YedZ